MELSLVLANMAALTPGPWHLNPRAFGDSHLQFRLSRVTLFLEPAFYCSMHVSKGVYMYVCVCAEEKIILSTTFRGSLAGAL